ncbi:MAG: hypothetical protein ACE5GS_01265 [Kiloniellaceae bacterium]
MITFGICLIYYGIALFLYQVNGWLTEGRWVPFPVVRAWEAFFGGSAAVPPALKPIVGWLLDWPLSLALLVSGLGILATVFAYRRLRELRRDQMRRKWLEEQCKTLGYYPWDVPRVLKELDQELRSPKAARR